MKKLLITAFAIYFTILVASMTVAHHPETPKVIEGVTIVNVDEARALVAEKAALIYDVRKSLMFGQGHIPGAVSMPYKWLTKGDMKQREGTFDHSRLTPDKSSRIIIHGDGKTSWESYNTARKAKQEGYKNIYWMRDGYNDWVKKGYPVTR